MIAEILTSSELRL